MKVDAVVIGAGVVGAHAALQLLDRGLSVAIVEPGTPGGTHAASYGNAAWIGSHSVVPQALPGIWTKLPSWLGDPLGPLAVRPTYLPRALPWLLRYLNAGATVNKVTSIAHALRTLLVDAPALHAEMAAQAGIPQLIDATSGLMHVYRNRESFENESLAWTLRRQVGIEWDTLEGEALAARQPNVSPDYRYGVFVAEAGHCRNPGAYVAGLVAHAQARGARRVAAAATRFKKRGGHITAVVTPVGEIACDAAVIATGIHSQPLAAAAGDRIPLDSERGYHVMLKADDPSDDWGPTTPVMVGGRNVAIAQLEPGLRCAGQVEIAGVDAAPNWRRADILRKHLLAVFPHIPRDLPASRITYWLGHRPS